MENETTNPEKLNMTGEEITPDRAPRRYRTGICARTVNTVREAWCAPFQHERVQPGKKGLRYGNPNRSEKFGSIWIAIS